MTLNDYVDASVNWYEKFMVEMATEREMWMEKGSSFAMQWRLKETNRKQEFPQLIGDYQMIPRMRFLKLRMWRANGI